MPRPQDREGTRRRIDPLRRARGSDDHVAITRSRTGAATGDSRGPGRRASDDGNDGAGGASVVSQLAGRWHLVAASNCSGRWLAAPATPFGAIMLSRQIGVHSTAEHTILTTDCGLLTQSGREPSWSLGLRTKPVKFGSCDAFTDLVMAVFSVLSIRARVRCACS
jgi:hypothetical protein